MRFWGYLLLGVVLFAWASGNINSPLLIAGSVLTLVYLLVGAPMWCMAENRDHSSCRNNANGLLLGCRIREHKWQRLSMLRRRQRWGELVRKRWASFGGCAASVSALAAVVSALTGAVGLVANG